MNERVTWLMPVKNGMPYLPETLASVERQSYRDWEVLVWENGSTDGTVEELRRWIPARLPGWVVTGQPCSVAESCAKLVDHCRTELCARIDADDVNLPERLARQVAFLAAHPEVAAVGSRMLVINDQGQPVEGVYEVPLEHDDIVHAMLAQNAMAHPSVMFRRAAVLQVGNYRQFPEWPGVEDYDLWMRLAAAGHKLANLGELLVRYRYHAHSVIQVITRDQRLGESKAYCRCLNAPALFGCPPEDMRWLIDKRYRCAVGPLWRIARHLHRTQGGPWLDRMRSDSFVAAARGLISSRDVVTRLFLAGVERRPFSLVREVGRILAAAAALRRWRKATG